MVNLKAVNNFIIVEQFDKLRKKTNAPFVTPVTSNNLGTIKYSANPDYPVGAQIYYGGSYEKMLVEGTELIVLKAENVVAVMDSNGEQD